MIDPSFLVFPLNFPAIGDIGAIARDDRERFRLFSRGKSGLRAGLDKYSSHLSINGLEYPIIYLG